MCDFVARRDLGVSIRTLASDAADIWGSQRIPFIGDFQPILALVPLRHTGCVRDFRGFDSHWCDRFRVYLRWCAGRRGAPSSVLPEHHLSQDSKDVVKMGMGLIATLAALVLGLLIASAKSSFDAQRTGFQQLAANLVLLDRSLARYGPQNKKRAGGAPPPGRLGDRAPLAPRRFDGHRAAGGHAGHPRPAAESSSIKFETSRPRTTDNAGPSPRPCSSPSNLAEAAGF